MATIELRDVSKIFPPTRERAYPVTALDGVNLTIPDGTTTSVVGPSGCGKSSLLRVVAGLTEYEGEVLYDGQNMEEIPPKERYIGMVFQDYALYPHLPGYGNLRFFFKVRKRPPMEAVVRIEETADVMGYGFNQLLRRRPGTLSNGEQQRLAIARAIVRHPKVLLFDEPLSHLDARLRVRTRSEIKRLLERFEITTVYVTHDQSEALAMGDTIAVMREGRIAQVGSYDELISDPANAFVAEFIGDPPMNLLRAVVVEGGARIADAVVPLPGEIASRLGVGDLVILGIRPEDVLFPGEDAALPEDGVPVEVRVELVTPDFGLRRKLVQAQIDGASLVWIVGEDRWLGVGERTEVVLPPDRLFFFDAENEERLDYSKGGLK